MWGSPANIRRIQGFSGVPLLPKEAVARIENGLRVIERRSLLTVCEEVAGEGQRR